MLRYSTVPRSFRETDQINLRRNEPGNGEGVVVLSLICALMERARLYTRLSAAGHVFGYLVGTSHFVYFG
jgi:hypothetical protein